MTKDAADRHVERWRDHWIDAEFSDDVELMTIRIVQIHRYLRDAKQHAAERVELQDFEYDTLHKLMIRDTPGRASPSELADDLGVSKPGMTGRLDKLEKRGYVQRVPGGADRRTVDVEVTSAGLQVWRKAMTMRGNAEDDLAGAVTPQELARLNRLLKKMTLYIESLQHPA